MALRRQHLPASPGVAVDPCPDRRRRLQASLGDHRRQVDLGEVAVPVDAPRVEVEALPVVRGQRIVQRQQLADPEGRLALHVAAVEVHVAERPLHLGAFVGEVGGDARLLAAHRQGGQHLLAGLEGALGALQAVLHPLAAGIRPARRGDRLVALVVDGVLAEPGVRPVVQILEAEGVHLAGGHLHHLRLPVRRGAVGGHGAHRRGHLVHGDDVEGALWGAGEVLQQAAGVGDDDRLGHPEAADPAGERLGQGRLDDRRPHDGERDGAAGLGEGRLGEGLGEPVGVGEAEGGRPRPAHVHQPGAHPALADLLALGAEGGGSGCAEFAVRLLGELLETFGCAALVLDGVATAVCRGRLGAPVHRNGEVTLGEEFLRSEPPPVARHVRRRDRDEVGGGADVGQQLHEADRPQQVRLDGQVEGVVEGDRRGRVDEDVATRQEFPPLGVTAQTVRTHVG